MTVAEKIPIVAAERSTWLETIETLFRKVEAWASAQGWAAHRRTKEFTDESLSGSAQESYTVPTLEIAVPAPTPPRGRDEKVILEPVMFNPITGIGRVDFYVWPAMYRVRMIRRSDEWIIKTDSGIDWPLPWSEQTFVQIAEGFLNA